MADASLQEPERPSFHRRKAWKFGVSSKFRFGHAAEFGIVAAKNISHLPALLEAIVAEAAVPDAAKAMLAPFRLRGIALYAGF